MSIIFSWSTFWWLFILTPIIISFLILKFSWCICGFSKQKTIILLPLLLIRKDTVCFSNCFKFFIYFVKFNFRWRIAIILFFFSIQKCVWMEFFSKLIVSLLNLFVLGRGWYIKHFVITSRRSSHLSKHHMLLSDNLEWENVVLNLLWASRLS